MANKKLSYNPSEILSSLSLIESLQTPKVRTGGASSSRLFNQFITYIKRDLLNLGSKVEDVSDASRIQALMLNTQNASFSAEISSLRAILLGLSNNGSQNRTVADFYSNLLTTASSTTADINPLFGQAILPAISRQSALVIQRGNGECPAIPADTHIKYCLQPTVTTALNATAPADYFFSEDIYSILALDGREDTAWVIEDPTLTPHVNWVEIDLPGNVSGSYVCNELSWIPWPTLSTDVIAVQADVIGLGWTSLDYSYLTNYDPSTLTVRRAGPCRLCFPRTSATRFRIGIWSQGVFGFQSINVYNATYQNTATLAADFTSITTSALTSVSLFGKDTSDLALFPVSVSGDQVGVTITPPGTTTETPVVTGIGVTF